MEWSNRFLDKKRLQGDEAADKLIAGTFSKGEQSTLYALLKLEEDLITQQPNSALKKFLIYQKVKPTWFDARRLHHGQRLFHHYASEMMALLGAMSLPYCYAASPGNKALYLSDKMRHSPGKRLMDTASFVIEVLTPGNLDDGNTGHIPINKVRLIHALSRYYLKKQGQWDRKWGQPINQEDMAGTNLAFSYIILLGMQQSGFTLSQKEKEDFLFAWRYIGYLLDIHEDLLPVSFAEARQLATIIKERNFKKTEEGIILTSELLSYYKTSVPSWQAKLVPSQIRFYLGNEVAEYIGISSDPVRDRITSSISAFQSLQNMLTVKSGSYQHMLHQHTMLKKKFI
jgi:hypothetical protein